MFFETAKPDPDVETFAVSFNRRDRIRLAEYLKKIKNNYRFTTSTVTIPNLVIGIVTIAVVHRSTPIKFIT